MVVEHAVVSELRATCTTPAARLNEVALTVEAEMRAIFHEEGCSKIKMKEEEDNVVYDGGGRRHDFVRCLKNPNGKSRLSTDLS
jgi:porphobilinogen deaminase